MMKGLFGKAKTAEKVVNVDEKLLKYVEKSLRVGQDEKSIRKKLKSVGWKDVQVDSAFSFVNREKAGKNQEESKAKPQDGKKSKPDSVKEESKDGKQKTKDEKKAEEKKRKEEQKKEKEERKAIEKKKKEEEKSKKKDEEQKKKEEKESAKKEKKEAERKRKEEEKQAKKKKDEKKDTGKKKDDGKKGKDDDAGGSKKKNEGKKSRFAFKMPQFPPLGFLKKKPGVQEKKKVKEEKGKEKKEEPAVDGTSAEGAAQKKKKKGLKLPVRMNLVPEFYRSWVGKQLYFSGSDTDPMIVIRKFAILCFIAGAVAGVIFSRYILYIFFGAFFGMFAFVNVMLVLSVDRRGRFVDEILPDALLLLSANIRSGYIPSRALILSARKEFGPLSDGIRKAGKEIMTGTSLEDGLKQIPQRIKSKDLERTIKLITEGIKGGGQIVTLLEENALDIRRRQAIRKEIAANIMMYAIFIAFAGCLGAPGLYALSGYLTTTMSALTPDVSMSDQISGKVSFISISGANVSPEFLFQFSIAAILITTIFGGLILGLINSGREKDGLKFAPILAIIALCVFFAATFLVNTMFSTMMPSG